MSGRNHPEYREQLQTKIQPNQRLLKFLVLEIIQTFMTLLLPTWGKTCLDLGKQPMKLGKRRPIRATPDTSGTLPLKIAPTRKSARRARSGINWTCPQKAKTPQRPNMGRQRYRATNGKKPAARQQLCCAGLPHPSGRISRFIRSRLMNSRTFSRSGVASALACGSIDARFLARLTAF